MGRVRVGLLVAVIPAVVSGLIAACTFGIDTSGLVGDGGHASDSARRDAPADVARVDARSDAPPFVDGGTDAAPSEAGEAAPPDSAAESGPTDAGDATTDDCSISAVQAVPGTSVYHVMTDGGAEQQSITETAGNLLVAVAYGGQGPGNTTPLTTVPNMTFSVTDTIGNTYYAAPMYENGNSHQAAIQIFYAPDIKAGANTVTVNSATALGLQLQTGLFLQEYSGAATTDVVDISSGQMAPSSTTTVQPGNMTTSVCGRVIGAFADGHVVGQTLSPGAGWNLRSTDDWDPGAACDSILPGVPAHSVMNAVFKLSVGPDDGWVAAQVAFRGASTPAPVQPDKVVFAGPPVTVTAGACSSIVTLRSQFGSKVANTSTGIAAALTGTGISFYIDSGCVYPIKNLYIGAGTYAQSFYFIGASKGSPVITATPTILAAATQTETVD